MNQTLLTRSWTRQLHVTREQFLSERNLLCRPT